MYIRSGRSKQIHRIEDGSQHKALCGALVGGRGAIPLAGVKITDHALCKVCRSALIMSGKAKMPTAAAQGKSE